MKRSVHQSLSLLLPALFVVIFQACSNFNEEPDKTVHSTLLSEIAVLRSLNVKSITETKYAVKDRSGDIIKDEFMYAEKLILDDKSEDIQLYSYDVRGNTNWIKTCTIDQGKLAGIKTVTSDGTKLSRTDYLYDEKGDLLEVNDYDGEGHPVFKSAYWFDKNNNMQIINEYVCDFKSKESLPVMHERKIVHKYNRNGYQVESEYFDKREQLVMKKSYEYDSTGYFVIEELFSQDMTKSDALPPRTTYRCDSFGRLLEKNEYDADSKLIRRTTSEYEFDERGIWIKQVEFESISESAKETPIAIAERLIEY